MKGCRIFGLITLVVITILSVIACELTPEDKNPFEGTWVSIYGTAIFEESSWTIPKYKDGAGYRGTYIFIDYTAKINYEDITNYDGTTWRPISSSDKASDFVPTAEVSGNKLIWGNTTYTKQKE